MAIQLRGRFSFAPNGDIWIADVDEATEEEINRVDEAGANFGWPRYEGTACLGDECGTTGLTVPVVTYPHTGKEPARGGRKLRVPW